MTLNAAFKNVFGEGLKEHGFVKARSQYPVFARCINNDIVHVITFRKCYRSKDFCVMCGVATVYRAEVHLPENKHEVESVMYAEWLDEMYSFDGMHSEVSYPYNDYDIENVMRYALGRTEKYILPVLDMADSPAGCIEYFLTMQRSGSQLSLRKLYENKGFAVNYPKDRETEAMLWVLLNDREYYRSFSERQLENSLRQIELWEKDGSWGSYLGSDRTAAEQGHADRLACYDKVFADKEWLSRAETELERRRTHNLQTLKEYGLITEETT